MIIEALCAVAPFAAVFALFVPPSVILANWSSGGSRARSRHGRDSGSSSGLWATLSCLSHLLLLSALWFGAALQHSLDLQIVVILLMPLLVVANWVAWMLARPIWPKRARTRFLLSIAAGSCPLLAALIAGSGDAPGLVATLGGFGAINLLALVAVNRRIVSGMAIVGAAADAGLRHVTRPHGGSHGTA